MSKMKHNEKIAISDRILNLALRDDLPAAERNIEKEDIETIKEIITAAELNPPTALAAQLMMFAVASAGEAPDEWQRKSGHPAWVTAASFGTLYPESDMFSRENTRHILAGIAQTVRMYFLGWAQHATERSADFLSQAMSSDIKWRVDVGEMQRQSEMLTRLALALDDHVDYAVAGSLLFLHARSRWGLNPEEYKTDCLPEHLRKKMKDAEEFAREALDSAKSEPYEEPLAKMRPSLN